MNKIKTNMPIEVKQVYAIQNIAGRIHATTCSYSEEECIKKYVSSYGYEVEDDKELWEQSKQAGYKCIKVKIVPIEE